MREFQETASRLMRASLERLGPIKEAREEIADLKQRLAELEVALARAGDERDADVAGTPPAAGPAAGAE